MDGLRWLGVMVLLLPLGAVAGNLCAPDRYWTASLSQCFISSPDHPETCQDVCPNGCTESEECPAAVVQLDVWVCLEETEPLDRAVALSLGCDDPLPVDDRVAYSCCCRELAEEE
jgi:hypothetical protein